MCVSQRRGPHSIACCLFVFLRATKGFAGMCLGPSRLTPPEFKFGLRVGQSGSGIWAFPFGWLNISLGGQCHVIPTSIWQVFPKTRGCQRGSCLWPRRRRGGEHMAEAEQNLRWLAPDTTSSITLCLPEDWVINSRLIMRSSHRSCCSVHRP